MNTTIELHPEFLTKNGEREFAILSYGEFQALQEWLEDIEDILDLRQARETDAGQPNMTLEEVELKLGMR
ncbi:MAG TPA: hypothetical protein VK468_10830 [Pyrinomonadaceae bacterium]|nr:hypothetical protein [Pyrinomonadaceae bacterium]